MAIKNDYPGIGEKTQNEGTTDAGRLTHLEWNALVDAVDTVQTKLEGTTNIKGIKYNGVQKFDKIDEDGYLEMTIADASGYDLKATISTPPTYVAYGASCPISVYVSSKNIQGPEPVPASASCIVSVYIDDILVNTGNVYDVEYGNSSNTEYYDPSKSTLYTFDLATATAKQLAVGVLNTIKIVVNNRFGKIFEDYRDVNVIELALDVQNFTTVYTETNKPTIRAIVSGTDGTINAKVDGQTIVHNFNAPNGETVNIAASYFEPLNSHGVHTLEIWASVKKHVGSTEFEIATEPQYFTYIYGTSNPQPIVMSTITNVKPEEYSTFNMSYIAYKYNDTATVVKDKVTIALYEYNGYDEHDNAIPGRQLGEAVESDIEFNIATNSGTGSASISLFPILDGDNSISLVGKKFIKMTIGTNENPFIQYTEIEVLKSSVKLSQLGGYAVYLTSAGRNNTQSNKRSWVSNGHDAKGYPLTVNTLFDENIEFIDTGSGWIADDEGNVAMHLNKGKYFTLDYQPFTDNPVFNDSTNNGTDLGKTISFELATRNCLKTDSPVITCLDDSNGTERGFVITASSAILKSNNFGMEAKFRENTRVKIDFVIEGLKNEYKYTTIVGKDADPEKDWEKDKTSREALCIIYVDGVYQSLRVIPDGCTFKQGRTNVPAPKIRFGSEDCDVDIYNIRIYDQPLTPTQIVNNYAYDTPKYEDKLEIAKRNDIFDATSLGNKPNINIAKLRNARPNLPFWYIKMGMETVNGKEREVVLPYDKNDWRKLTSTRWDNPMNPNDKYGPAPSFTTAPEKGQLKNQGTSSMTYPWPWRNWDWKTKEFIYSDGTKEPKLWNQYDGMYNTEGLQKITLKKDYASSEMCNNAITSEYFTDMAIAIGGDFPDVLSPAQRKLGVQTPYRLTFRAIPCFMFQEFNDSTQEGTAGKGYDALGMMNLIANKNECGHLGFMGEYIWDPANGKKAQSWELADNMDDWFWYKEITPIHNEEGTTTNDKGEEVPYKKVVNECIECYEARYPKDSTLNEKLWNAKSDEADFGNIPDDYESLNVDQIAAIMEEQADIIEFHNWLVSCNRQIPVDYHAEHGVYRTLTNKETEAMDSWTIGVKDFTQDTPDYRLQKFINEAPTRLIIDQFCLYYVWRETFWAYDSGFKNLQVYSMGKAHEDVPYLQWGCMVRDADTTLGIENTGKSIFPPHLEDIDYYTADKDAEGNAVSNVKFVYGQAGNFYHAKSVDGLGGNPILNGQFGTLWINLRDGFKSRIGEIYRGLKTRGAANWNGQSAIKRFRDHQEKWCENLYNFGMRQYFGGAPFTKWITSGLGDKKNSRASWLERGFYYRDTKYKAVNDICTVRAVTYETPDLPGGDTRSTPLKMKAYIPMYFLSGASTEDPKTCTVSIRVTDTNNTFDVLPGPGGIGLPTSGDQNCWFWCTSMLTEIGDLARVCKVKTFQQVNLPKVRDFSLGHESARDGNTYKEYYYVEENGVSQKYEREFQNDILESITVDSLKSMTIFDITNHKRLRQIEGLQECTQLQELYARGTDELQTLSLPATTSLRKLYLGKSLSQIKLVDLTGIDTFVLEGADNIDYLRISNCGDYMAERSYEIALQVLPILKGKYDEDNTNLCQLDGIKWNRCTIDDIEGLYNINASLSGEITITGEKMMTNDLKVKLIQKYGNIDDPNNALYISYPQLAMNSITLPNKLYIHQAGDTPITFITTPTNANTYSYAEWTLSKNDYATINSKTGVITRNSTPADSNTPAATLKVTVYQVSDNNGYPRPEKVSNESKIYFYERHAKPGDIVYHDGSFTDEVDKTKTPIGVCFYVDPDNNQNRLMVALENISASTTNIGVYQWGIGSGNSYGDNNDIGSPRLDNPDNYGFDTMYDIINISDIYDTIDHGGDPTVMQMLSDDQYRNGNDDNDYFTVFPFSSCMGNIGFDTAKRTINVNYTDVIVKDSTYPAGYINTIAMIERRDTMMNFFPDLKITGTSGRYSEYTNLFTDIDNANNNVVINNWKGGNAATYMYPAASLCYAYEPGGEGLIKNLDDRFKKRNWFIPTSGDLARISYYMRQYYTKDSELPNADAFALAIDNKILKTHGLLSSAEGGQTMLSSTEYGTSQDNAALTCAVVISSGISKSTTTSSGVVYSGICQPSQKYGKFNLRAICRF